jgi:hypothetical protein
MERKYLYEIIYGFKEDSKNEHIAIECFDGLDECFGIFTTELYDDKMVEAVYGVICKLDFKTGQIILPDRKYIKLVHSFYDKFIKYHNSKGVNKNSKIGYFIASVGNFDMPQNPYEPFNPYKKQEWHNWDNY